MALQLITTKITRSVIYSSVIMPDLSGREHFKSADAPVSDKSKLFSGRQFQHKITKVKMWPATDCPGLVSSMTCFLLLILSKR